MKLAKPLVFIALLIGLGFALVMALEAAEPGESNMIEVLEQLNAPGGDYEGQFDVLIAAIGAASPVVSDTLSSNGQHTLFAPIDDAWVTPPPGLVSLLLPADAMSSASGVTTEQLEDSLTDILLYHIIFGRRNYVSLARVQQVRTVQGEFLYVVDGTLVDALGRPANFIANDISASNGVIHIIDALVLPFPP